MVYFSYANPLERNFPRYCPRIWQAEWRGRNGGLQHQHNANTAICCRSGSSTLPPLVTTAQDARRPQRVYLTSQCSQRSRTPEWKHWEDRTPHPAQTKDTDADPSVYYVTFWWRGLLKKDTLGKLMNKGVFSCVSGSRAHSGGLIQLGGVGGVLFNDCIGWGDLCLYLAWEVNGNSCLHCYTLSVFPIKYCSRPCSFFTCTNCLWFAPNNT